MPQSIIQVDAFTSEPFRGNPAAICVMEAAADDAWMQAVAAEMNLAETAFLHPEGDGYRLRWFTPATEVELCGHATVASAHVLWEEGRERAEAACRFHTRSGLLVAERDGDWIQVLFPQEPESEISAPAGLAEALGVRPRYVGENRLSYCLVAVGSEDEVRSAAPDFRALQALPYHGFIVTAPADAPDFDFVSRFFAPAMGIDEDPVTGSAHCVLAGYWQKRLGKSKLLARQISARTGVVRVSVDADGVRLGGRAVTVMRGTLA